MAPATTPVLRTVVHCPTAHAAEATWCARLVSPLATSPLATAVSARACQSGLRRPPCWWGGLPCGFLVTVSYACLAGGGCAKGTVSEQLARRRASSPMHPGATSHRPGSRDPSVRSSGSFCGLVVTSRGSTLYPCSESGRCTAIQNRTSGSAMFGCLRRATTRVGYLRGSCIACFACG